MLREILLQLVLPFATACATAWFTTLYVSKRDKRREVTVAYLIEAYRKLERCVDCNNLENKRDYMESAVADIQLLGSKSQAEMAERLAKELEKSWVVDIKPLLRELRRSLREKLGLEEGGDIYFLRFKRD